MVLITEGSIYRARKTFNETENKNIFSLYKTPHMNIPGGMYPSFAPTLSVEIARKYLEVRKSLQRSFFRTALLLLNS